MMRPMMLKYALPIGLTLVACPLQAQVPLGPSWETNVTLSQGDLDMIKTALATQIHGKKLGTTAAWSNPQTGNSGSVMLLSISSRDGRRCERIEYRMIPVNKAPFDRFVLTSCLQADGNWKLS